MRKMKAYLEQKAREFENIELKVGFASGATYSDGTSVADVAYRNEFGDPANNQPPRPFFRQAIAENKEEWMGTFKKGLIAGKPTRQIAETLGAQIKGDVYTSIATLREPPLSPVTLKLRRERGNNSDKPLVDTKIMINSLTYWVGDSDESTQDSE